MLFHAPQLDARDLGVIGEIDQMRVVLRQDTHAPKKWTGVLRRNLLAKAIQGSNSIEGYDVNEDTCRWCAGHAHRGKVASATG